MFSGRIFYYFSIMKKFLTKISIVIAVFSMSFAESKNTDNIVSVSGTRNAEDIAGEIRFHIVTMRYKFHLRKITPPNDAVVVRVSIDRFGNVRSPEIVSPDTLSAASREIILEDLTGWKFVQIREDGETIASFPLNLRNRLNR